MTTIPTLIKNTPSKWIIDRNINETYIKLINGSTGIYETQTLVLGEDATEFTASAYPLSYPTVDALIPSGAVIVNLLTTGGLFDWIIQLNDVLPIGARIISVDIKGACDSAITGSANPKLLLHSDSTTDIHDTFDFRATSGYVSNTILALTLVPGNTTTLNTFVVKPNSNTYLDLGGTLSNSTPAVFAFSGIQILYTF